MNIPKRYTDAREILPDEVSFGCGGIKIFSVAEIEREQLGYSVARDGSSLCTGTRGTWQGNWVVIGYETSLGDPIFVDMEDVALSNFLLRSGFSPAEEQVCPDVLSP